MRCRAADLYGGQGTIACPTASARYVTLLLPGSDRVLSLCEMEVLQKNAWVWRQLSGVIEAAQGQPVTTTSVVAPFFVR
jgi:hypothetical protein